MQFPPYKWLVAPQSIFPYKGIKKKFFSEKKIFFALGSHPP